LSAVLRRAAEAQDLTLKKSTIPNLVLFSVSQSLRGLLLCNTFQIGKIKQYGLEHAYQSMEKWEPNMPYIAKPWRREIIPAKSFL
jgi:hypothetical protein